MSRLHDEMLAEIRNLLRNKHWLKEDDGYFSTTLIPDYRDEISTQTANRILSSDDPQGEFWEYIDDVYDDVTWFEKNELQNELLSELTGKDGKYPNGLSPDEEATFYKITAEIISIDPPCDQLLKQEFCVNLMVDTGDGNYDYTLNGVYPCWYGGQDVCIDDKAALMWLTRTQGYTKDELMTALKQGDVRDPHGYLESVRVELANLPSHMSVLTFMVKMTLEQLIQLQEILRLREKDGHKYDPAQYPDCGYLEISKDVMCGLYDPWYGGGSVLEIQLEKDLRLPIKYLRSALPDGGDGYRIHEVYGVGDDLWTNDGVKGYKYLNNMAKVG